MIKIRRAFLVLTIVTSTILIGLNYITVKTTSAIRAYINGESQYSKGQKDATNHLILYVYSKNPMYWRSFQTNISIPLGDGIARKAMVAKGDRNIIEKGLLQGKNHPANIDDMIWLFDNFQRVQFMQEAIQFWADADEVVENLLILGQKIHNEIEHNALSEEKASDVLKQISTISAQLTEKQIGFSAVMEASARKINWYFHVINSCIILIIICSIGWFVMAIFNRVAASKKLRNQIMNKSLDANIWFDGNGIIQFWNPKAEQIFQWKRDEVIGKSIGAIVPLDKKEKFIQNIQSYQIGGRNEGKKLHQIIETVAYDRDNREFPIELSLINIKRPHGIFFCAQIRDITHRKKMEDRLHERKVYLQAILDSTNDGILAIGNLGDVLGYNNRFTELWNIPEELLTQNKNDAMIKHAMAQLQDPEQFIQNIKGQKNSDKPNLDILKFKDGKVFERNSTPLILNDKIKGRVQSFRDITSQLKSEVSIRKAEDRYRNLFEHAMEGIFMTSFEGQIIAVNPAMAKMYGYKSPEDMIGSISNVGQQVYADPQDRVEILNALNKVGSVSGIELMAKKKNGDLFWVRCHVREAIDHNSGTKYLEGSLEDITDRKVAEEQLLAQLDEVQKINFELDRFVYSVSHDLRAPLASILGLVNIAEMDSPSANQKSYLEKMRGSVDRLDKFIKDILDYSRNSRMEIQPTPIDFSGMVMEIRDNLSHMEGYSSIDIRTEINCLATFCSDKKRIEVIMYNLISNSIKYRDIQKSSSISINIKTDNKNAYIKVEDNGVGIGKEFIEKVFDMFYRASDLSTGAGLGLYILKETVTKLNGTLNLQSEQGKFTVFEITLPNLIETEVSQTSLSCAD